MLFRSARAFADVSDMSDISPGSRSENEELKRIFFTDDYTIQSMRLKGSPPSLRAVDCFYSVENGRNRHERLRFIDGVQSFRASVFNGHSAGTYSIHHGKNRRKTAAAR